jgi:hypothetical protein
MPAHKQQAVLEYCAISQIGACTGECWAPRALQNCGPAAGALNVPMHYILIVWHVHADGGRLAACVTEL